MKMSVAMRDGAKQTEELHEAWYEERDGMCATCAIGATYFAATGGKEFYCGLGSKGHTTIPQLLSLFPIANLIEVCPFGCKYYTNDFGGRISVPRFSVASLSSHLYESHGLSREAVSEWLGTIEDKVFGKNREEKSDPFVDKVVGELLKVTE